MRLGPNDAALGFARHRHTTTASKIEHALIAEDAKRPQHGIGVDAEDCRHVSSWREALTRTDITVCDVTTDLGGHQFVQGQCITPLTLDFVHSDNHSVTIMSGTSTALSEAPDDADHELVIREARRRQRRRWLVIAIMIAVAVGLSGVIIGLTGGRSAPRHSSTPPTRVPKARPLVPGTAGLVPERPTSLAIGPNQNLYIADDVRNEVLERLPNGTFEPVAGSGTIGFSGDGGPATHAQLNDPAGITFGPDGTLYIADYGNGRIRAVSPAGTITTIAGNGGQTSWVADGTPALQASFEPTAMTFGPGGLMYVAAGQEVLKLNPDGTFSRVLGENTNEYAGLYGIGGPARVASADGANGVAIDSSGNVYVSGSNTKSILMIDPQRVVHYLGSLYPRGASGLVNAPDGSVVAMDELAVVGLSPQGFKTLVSFPTTDKISYLGITGFSPNGIAVAPDGTIYLDTYYGNGYTDKSALISIPAQGSGAPSLLWEQRSP